MNHTLENNMIKISVSEDGAQLNHLIYQPDHCELLWQGDPKIWSGQAPILFPIVGRLWQDCYSADRVTYSLPKHGFARHSEFTVTQSSDDALCFTLTPNEQIRQQYPFAFVLNIHFRLVQNTVKICYEVVNEDTRTLWFSIGGHPGFRCQMGDQLVFDRPEALISAFIDSEGYLEQKTKIISSNGVITVTPDSFLHDAYIFHHLQSSRVILKKQDTTPDIGVDFTGAEYLGIWAKPGAPYVCIEPWTGLNDSRGRTGELADKKSITSLNAGERFRFCYEIQVLPKK